VGRGWARLAEPHPIGVAVLGTGLIHRPFSFRGGVGGTEEGGNRWHFRGMAGPLHSVSRFVVLFKLGGDGCSGRTGRQGGTTRQGCGAASCAFYF